MSQASRGRGATAAESSGKRPPADSGSSEGLSVDTKNLRPLPSQGFVDSWAVFERGPLVEFAFFDRLHGERPPLARVVMSAESLALVWQNSETFYRDVGIWLAARRLVPIRPEGLKVTGDTPARPATLLTVFRLGTEGSLEFYYVEPRAVVMAKREQPSRTRSLTAVPVLTLSVPTALQVGLFGWLESQLPRLQAAVAVGSGRVDS